MQPFNTRACGAEINALHKEYEKATKQTIELPMSQATKDETLAALEQQFNEKQKAVVMKYAELIGKPEAKQLSIETTSSTITEEQAIAGGKNSSGI